MKTMTMPALIAGCLLSGSAPADGPIRIDPALMEEGIVGLSVFGANPQGGVSRVAFSEADIAGRAYIRGRMRGAGWEKWFAEIRGLELERC